MYIMRSQVGMELNLVVGFNTARVNPINVLEQLCAVNFNLSTFKKAISVYATK